MERVTEDGSAPDVIADHPHSNEGDGEERGPVDGTNSDGEGNEATSRRVEGLTRRGYSIGHS